MLQRALDIYKEFVVLGVALSVSAIGHIYLPFLIWVFNLDNWHVCIFFYKLEWISRKTIHDGFNVWLDTSYHRPSKENSER